MAKHDAFKTLDTRTVVIIMDWAMKLLPMYFRERMTDFFGKRGRNWHVSAVVTKVNDELSVECFVHVFDNCTQNWFAVASILEHVLTRIKSEDARLHKARFRPDNAGCYDNASNILSLKVLGERTGIHVERYDFSETQSGKDICDRKMATRKQHIRRYVNEKNDVLTASDVKKALESHGGVRGYRVAVAQINTAQADDSDPQWPGISFLYSFSFNKSGVRAWRAYDVGKGHHSSYHELPCVQPEATGITIVHGFSRPSHPIGSMVETDPTSRSGGKIFGCNDPNCVLTFDSEQNQQHHIDVGDHQKVVENESAYDKVKIAWARRISEIGPNASVSQQEYSELIRSSANKGWALKSSKRAVRMSPAVKDYLLHKFNAGAVSGHKADPAQVSKEMMFVGGKDRKLIFCPRRVENTARNCKLLFSPLSAAKAKAVRQPSFD